LGFRTSSYGAFKPNFHEAWKILKYKKLRIRNVASTGDALSAFVTDTTARDVQIVKFKRKYNKEVLFPTAGNTPINLSASDRTYMFCISYNNAFRYGGLALDAASC